MPFVGLVMTFKISDQMSRPKQFFAISHTETVRFLPWMQAYYILTIKRLSRTLKLEAV